MNIAEHTFRTSGLTMRDIQILQQTIQNQCPSIHKKRVSSLILATKSVLDNSDLTLIKLGRKLETNTTVKHAIKRVDRLLGNHQLHREKDLIYKWYTYLITSANPCPVISACTSIDTCKLEFESPPTKIVTFAGSCSIVPFLP